MGRIVAVTNLKGGIGKTTTVVNVGAGLALKGAHVLLVDVDAQGNLALALGISPRRTLYEPLVDGASITKSITSARPNLDLIAADESLLGAQPILARRPDWSRILEQVLQPLKRAYDFIFIDCGGSMTVLNINALIAASDVVIPTTVEHLSIKGLEKLFKQVASVKNGVGSIRVIIPTMYDPRRRQSVMLLEHLHTTYGSLVAPPIRVNVRLSESSSAGRTIYEYDRRSRGSLDYAQLVERLSTMWNFQSVPTAAAQSSSIPAMSSSANGQETQSTPLPQATPVATTTVPAPLADPLPATVAPATSSATVNGHHHVEDEPVVMGAGNMLQNTCPNCGHPLHRATVAGYRVAYCDHCKYKQQELVSRGRR